MELSSDSKRLTFTIDNYQFLDATNEDDRNWLMIHVLIIEPSRRWSFNEPFLMTWDLPMWAEWFENLLNQTGSDYLPDSDHVLCFKFHDVNGQPFPPISPILPGGTATMGKGEGRTELYR